MRPARTVLEQKIRERRFTFEEFTEFAAKFALEHGEVATLSARHVQRLASGQGPGGKPLGAVRPATARLLESIFGLSMDHLLTSPLPGIEQPGHRRGVDSGGPAEVEASGQVDDWTTGDRFEPAFAWLDGRAGWPAGTTVRRVAARAAKIGDGDLAARLVRRGKVRRSQVADALAECYGEPGELRQYAAQARFRELRTGILTRAKWLDLGVPLTWEHDHLRCTGTTAEPVTEFDGTAARNAVYRLAEAVTLNTRVTTSPVYRLLSADVSLGGVGGELGLAPFVDYALTADLLEGELLDAIAERKDTRPGSLPLRDRYLPDLAAVLDLRGRLCAGGVLALCAIARPADPYRGPADFALLVQERSGNVLNAAGRLAVIPKGFHQPLKDVRADARIGATLLRELEEELFGRAEVDGTVEDRRVAAPMHPARYSEPMRWLTTEPGRMRSECTGFGFNLMSGNYEFAALTVIEDPEFWTRFGGDVAANWEATGLRLYSSLDAELVGDLIVDETWTDEGLFAFLQGVRRLSEIGGSRVALPEVELGS